MQAMQALTPEIVYVFFCVFWAYANAKAIQADTWILHGINGLLHLSFCTYFGLAIHPVVSFVLLFAGRLFFDVALNLFRGLPVAHVPKAPKSKVDQVEIAVFDALFRYLLKRKLRPSYPFVVGLLPKIIYALCLMVFLTIQFKIL